MDDNRRRNKRGRLRYELKHLAISTMSVILAWAIITFIVTKTHPSASMFDNYKYLFICLVMFVALSYLLAQLISDTITRVRKFIVSRHGHGKIKKKNG